MKDFDRVRILLQFLFGTVKLDIWNRVFEGKRTSKSKTKNDIGMYFSISTDKGFSHFSQGHVGSAFYNLLLLVNILGNGVARVADKG